MSQLGSRAVLQRCYAACAVISAEEPRSVPIFCHDKAGGPRLCDGLEELLLGASTGDDGRLHEVLLDGDLDCVVGAEVLEAFGECIRARGGNRAPMSRFYCRAGTSRRSAASVTLGQKIGMSSTSVQVASSSGRSFPPRRLSVKTDRTLSTPVADPLRTPW